VGTIVDVDPEEWSALWARRWQMYLDGISLDRYHDDAERWARLDVLRSRATFFVDAAHAPEVLRLIARPSTLDEHARLKMSSSLYLTPTQRPPGKGGFPFGCHIFLPGPEGDELGRLVFSGARSPLFPNSEELVAFWYDGRESDYDDVDLASMPIVEPIHDARRRRG